MSRGGAVPMSRPTGSIYLRSDCTIRWQHLGHFESRKVSTGTCGRAFGAACIHEHAYIRCSMLWPDPTQRDRLIEIRDNLTSRIEEAEREGWLGEVEGLKISLAAPKTNSPRSSDAPATAWAPSTWASPPSRKVADWHHDPHDKDQVQRIRSVAIIRGREPGSRS
jgi:hypothetical protein